MSLASPPAAVRRKARLVYKLCFTHRWGSLFLGPKVGVRYLKSLEERSGLDVGSVLAWFSKEFFNLEVGRWSYGYAQFLGAGGLISRIGSFCSIAPSVMITGINHPVICVTTHPIIFLPRRGFRSEVNKNVYPQAKNSPVIIGNDVWIGQNVTILPSIEIGDGAIIAAGCVVANNVPPYAVVAGVPGVVIRYRFPQAIIDMLLELRWWDWDDARIKESLVLMESPEEFCRHFVKAP